MTCYLCGCYVTMLYDGLCKDCSVQDGLCKDCSVQDRSYWETVIQVASLTYSLRDRLEDADVLPRTRVREAIDYAEAVVGTVTEEVRDRRNRAAEERGKPG